MTLPATHPRLLVLSGAGISKESGIPTFRDADGLWHKHRVEDVGSPAGWARDPALVWRFYSERRRTTLLAKPNAAHLALGRLSQTLGERMMICTQNIDSLHEQGGASGVVHVHGELFRSRCADACGAAPVVDKGVYEDGTALPKCAQCGALMRPDVVWFGEEPKQLHDIDAFLGECTHFWAIGTSGAVHPVAGFVKFLARRRPWVESVYVGPEAPDNGEWFQRLVKGTATEAVSGLVASMSASVGDPSPPAA